MSSINSYEAKTKFAELIRRASKGERITITRHGVPMAELIPASPAARMTPEEAVEALQRFPRVRIKRGESIKAMIEDGRR